MPIFIALRLLFDRKFLTTVAVLGFTLGVFPLITISGILRGFQSKFIDTILRNSPHVVLSSEERRTHSRPIDALAASDPNAVHQVDHEVPDTRVVRLDRPSEMVHALSQKPGVDSAAPSVLGNALVVFSGREHPVELRGIDPVAQNRVTPFEPILTEGSFRTFVAAHDSALVGAGLARDLGIHTGDTMSCVSSRGERMVLKVAGIFETAVNIIDKTRIYVHMRTGQSILGRGDVIDRIEVRLHEPDDADEQSLRIEHAFGYKSESWRQINANFLGLFAQQNQIIGFVIAALLAVGGFGILSIQIMMVLQKRREIAILRSVGFTKRDVMVIVLAQGALISLAGALIGSLLGHMALETLAHTKVVAGETFLHTDTWIIWESWIQYALAIAFASTVGLLSSALPAWQAARIEPVDVLRGQM